MFLPTTKQPTPKYKSNPDAVNNKPKSSANNVHRKSQSSEKSHTTSKNGRKNSTTISNARSLDTVVSSSSDTSKTVVATSAAVLSKIDRLVKSVSQVSSAKKVIANVKRKDLATKVTTTSISSDNSTIAGASSSKVAPTCLNQQNDSVLCVDNSPVATVNNPESSVVAVDNSSNHSLTNTAQNNNESPSLDESSTPEQVSPNTDTPSAESLVVVDSQGGREDSVGGQIGSVVFTPHRQPILCLKVRMIMHVFVHNLRH